MKDRMSRNDKLNNGGYDITPLQEENQGGDFLGLRLEEEDNDL